MELILGSGSPRRRALLEELGVAFTVVKPVVRERRVKDDAVATVSLAALAKHRWCRKHYLNARIITADTAVEFEGKVLGKPRSLKQATEWLMEFSGREQRVYTAVALSEPEETVPRLRLARSTVTFKSITPEVARTYVATVRPIDRAGGCDIDVDGDTLIAGYTGSYTNIVGLPVELILDFVE